MTLKLIPELGSENAAAMALALRQTIEAVNVLVLMENSEAVEHVTEAKLAAPDNSKIEAARAAEFQAAVAAAVKIALSAQKGGN